MDVKHYVYHALLPVTMLFTYFIVYYSAYYTIIGLAYFFTWSWFWVLIFFPIAISVIYLITSLPGLILNVTYEALYKNSWLSIILHSTVAAYSVFLVYMFLKHESNISIKVFWEVSKFKTIILFFPGLGIIAGIIYTFCLSQISDRLNKKMR